MRERIADHIAINGPMPFDVYMEWCLYDGDEGFFAAGPVRSGKRGDFVTSPEISWAFGYCVGEWARENAPGPDAVLVEIGSGSGAMLEQMADAWAAGSIYAIELSAEAQGNIARDLDDVNVLAFIDEIPRGTDAVVIANEVLDNMPAALARRVGDGWVEIGVDVVQDRLALVDVPARRDVSTWCDDVFGAAPYGTVVSVQIAVSEWIESAFERFDTVAMCLIDYGGTSEELASRNRSEVVRTYRKHQSGLGWLQSPGQTDVTVDVNVDGVVAAIERAGGEATVVSQREFCLAHGLEELIADASGLEQVAAKAGDVLAQLTNRSERLDMEALIDPSGLGAFKVILVNEGTA